MLRSDATQEEKSAACRQLARVATKEAVPTLAALLGDEKLSHMARYALETIPDPSVDDALRDALGKVKGRPLLGVIGSLGVRRDAKAVDALAKLLADADADVAQAAARALGKIGTPEAAKALEDALAGASAANQVAFCEGLFRCAEALAAEGQARPVAGDLRPPARPGRRRRSRSAPAALRGAILAAAEGRHPAAGRSHPRRGLRPDGRRRADGHGTARPGGHRRAGRRVAQAARRQADPVDQHAGLPGRRVGRAGPARRWPPRAPTPCAWPPSTTSRTWATRPPCRCWPSCRWPARATWPPPRGPAWATSPARTPMPPSWPCSPTRTPRSAAWPSR